MGSDQEQVLVEMRNSGRILTLNRPKQLNALSFEMVSRLLELFLAYQEDPNVKVVILKGIGRAFCSGGDVATVARDIRKGDWRLGTKFFSTEFTLNFVMATCSKPQVSILHGIVMGGGNGASMHGQFRVVTDRTVFAMPETALGLIPDVGATYFLSRLPGFFGEYLGLTGARLDGAEMLACGLATHFVPASRLSALEAALCTAGSSDPTIISRIIDQFTELPNLKEQSAYNRLDIIERCFSRRTLEEILSALEREFNVRTDSWISSTIQMLKAASPTSLKVCLRSIREGRLQSIGQCLMCEYRLVSHLVRGDISKDFHEVSGRPNTHLCNYNIIVPSFSIFSVNSEISCLIQGCRALLLDKDKKPKWEPSRLELVSDQMVDQYFLKLKAEDWQDLKLPPRPNLPVHAFSKL